MKVLLRAPLLTNSGYGVHSRQIFEWLDSKNNIDLSVECLNWGRTSWLLDEKTDNGLVGKIMRKSKQKQPPYDVTIQVQLPDEWDNSLGKKNIGISAFVETDKCNPAWVENCNKMDHIIVPSTFTKNVIKNTGITKTKISVVPEWFNHDIIMLDNDFVKIEPSVEELKFSSSFNFLVISQLTALEPENDRKNLYNCIKWLCETFEGNPDVGIVLKTNMGKGTTIDRQLSIEAVSNIIRASRKGKYPKINLVHGTMTSKEIASLYHKDSINCYVSATRGEGYGLPIIDAAVVGMPIVATGWSGHLEFLDEDLFYAVDYNLEKIKPSRIDNRVFFEGFRWANPKRESFIKQVLRVYRNYEEAKEKSEKLKNKVRKSFNKKEIKKMYDNIFENL